MREGDIRIPSGCAIACIFHSDKQKENGERIMRAMAMMHDRSNGLGGGFVGYGIYPEHADAYALHLLYDDETAKETCERYLKDVFWIKQAETILTQATPAITDVPILWRYFVHMKGKFDEAKEKDRMVKIMFHINRNITGTYLFSCGKNMGVFKGVGYPEDIAVFYRLDTYEAYTWIAHGRYPTNTPGWWAGAHPFSMLDFALVHNGEISSYDTNRRYIEMFDYPCSLLTDTEVITYLLDFLMRKKGLSFTECAQIIAAPFWEEIDEMEAEDKRYYTMIRRNLGSLLITGPFSIILGFENGIAALNDRLKLRSLMVAKKKHCYYLASEESAIRKMEADLDELFSLDGGKAFTATFREVAS